VDWTVNNLYISVSYRGHYEIHRESIRAKGAIMIQWIEMLLGGRKKRQPEDTLSGTLNFSCYLSDNPNKDVKRIKQTLNTFLRRHPDRSFYHKPFIEVLEPESIFVSVFLCADNKEQLMLYTHEIANDLKSQNLAHPGHCFLSASCGEV
jgi:hypothetical protein